MIIAHQNIHFLEQGLDLLSTAGEHYSMPGPAGQSSTGAHMRHVLDCYRCFLRGVESDLRVNYDARERDPRTETDAGHAAAVARDLIDSLRALTPDDLVRGLQVQVDAAAWEQGEELWSVSSVARELQFLLSHTVHHYAIMSLILRSNGFDPGDQFGVAPSTLENRRQPAPVGI